MPCKKGSIDKNFGRKFLDGAKYVGKNSWKVLPVAGLIDFAKNYPDKGSEFIRDVKSTYHFLNVAVLTGYVITGISFGTWTPQQYREYSNKQKTKNQNIQQINVSYDSLFKDTKTFSDSLAVYQKYALPIKFGEPTFDEKETAIKMNNLEKGIK